MPGGVAESLWARESPCKTLGAHTLSWGQAWAEGEGELATFRHRADSGRELGKNMRRIVYKGRLHARIIRRGEGLPDADGFLLPCPRRALWK